MTIHWQSPAVEGRTMRTYVAVPDSPGPHPGVLVAMTGLGINSAMLDVVHRLHRAGYAAALPDLFYRQPAELPDPMSRIKLMRDDEVVADMNAAAACLKSTGKLGPLGVTGFCMGGRVAYLMACANKELKAAAVFYGGGILTAWGSGPTAFERSKDIACPMLGFFGVTDTNPSPEDVKKIDAELTRLGKWHEFHSYQDTGHAFLNIVNPEAFRERASRSAWPGLIAFFDEFLKQGGHST